MYNSYFADKVAKKSQAQQFKQLKLKQWVDNYYNKVRPQLLIKYNKRINSFIRKMEQNPMTMKTQSAQLSTMRHQFRDTYGKKQAFIGSQWFKFKDSEDWKSLYTPLQRLQRKKNMNIFKEKFGDANLAFRSIGSQSDYVSSAKKQFRIRQKSKQINPPMRYTNKSIMKTIGTNQKSNKNTNNKDHQQLLHRRNTSSSSGNLAEDDMHSQNMSLRQHSLKAESLVDNDDDENLQMIKERQLQNDDKKMHFKRMIDIEQTVTDQKTKKCLRDILTKCGVYRNKNKRVTTQAENDKFEELQK